MSLSPGAASRIPQIPWLVAHSILIVAELSKVSVFSARISRDFSALEIERLRYITGIVDAICLTR